MSDNKRIDQELENVYSKVSAKNPVFVLEYMDRKGIISQISSILAENDINIASMIVTREGNIATMQCEVESPLSDQVKEKLSLVGDFSKIQFIDSNVE